MQIADTASDIFLSLWQQILFSPLNLPTIGLEGVFGIALVNAYLMSLVACLDCANLGC